MGEKVKPPYLLVGHSFGGIYVRVFAPNVIIRELPLSPATENRFVVLVGLSTVN